METRQIAQERANEIWAALDDYSRWQLAAWGTAFTTYEDEGDAVCFCLRIFAREWHEQTKEER